MEFLKTKELSASGLENPNTSRQFRANLWPDPVKLLGRQKVFQLKNPAGWAEPGDFKNHLRVWVHELNRLGHLESREGNLSGGKGVGAHERSSTKYLEKKSQLL
jgi:hypothetical protein